MTRALVCVAAAACGDPGTVDPVERRVVVPISAGNATTLSIPRPSEVAAGDLIVVMVQTGFANRLEGYPEHWAEIWEPQASNCTPWSGTYVRGIARADDLSFDLIFTRADEQYRGLLIAYRNARDPNVLAQRRVNTGSELELVTSFAPSPAPPGSVMALLGISDEPWDNTPPGLAQHGAIDNLVVYEAEIDGDETPPVDVTLGFDQCVGLLQLRIQPR